MANRKTKNRGWTQQPTTVIPVISMMRMMTCMMQWTTTCVSWLLLTLPLENKFRGSWHVELCAVVAEISMQDTVE
ncbi:hypothetical protein [Chlamydia abortus]|uniref:hypothetical protein n=1 Tax=Chlamydia abortus TaxID=83555 RepID=UPI000A27EE6C|nr:hypothetical protein [Chlamydia abortus]QRR32226.1 hypothetical protein JS522_01185 [Chlamydia abortus]SGA33919.1 Uncharacterised protein [Chlamydia abortus]